LWQKHLAKILKNWLNLLSKPKKFINLPNLFFLFQKTLYPKTTLTTCQFSFSHHSSIVDRCARAQNCRQLKSVRSLTVAGLLEDRNSA
jgi:hypothetical protein